MNDAELVLLVEDSATQAAHMRFILEDAGYRVALAVDGVAGLEQVRRERPLVVVTDLHMPNMNGLELVEKLGREFSSLPVILTTAEGSEDIAAEALGKGAASYVPKRKAETMLVDTVRQILKLARADRMAQRLMAFQTSSLLTFSLDNDDSLVPAVIARLRDPLQEMGICDEKGDHARLDRVRRSARERHDPRQPGGVVEVARRGRWQAVSGADSGASRPSTIS